MSSSISAVESQISVNVCPFNQKKKLNLIPDKKPESTLKKERKSIVKWRFPSREKEAALLYTIARYSP